MPIAPFALHHLSLCRPCGTAMFHKMRAVCAAYLHLWCVALPPPPPSPPEGGGCPLKVGGGGYGKLGADKEYMLPRSAGWRWLGFLVCCIKMPRMSNTVTATPSFTAWLLHHTNHCGYV